MGLSITVFGGSRFLKKKKRKRERRKVTMS